MTDKNSTHCSITNILYYFLFLIIIFINMKYIFHDELYGHAKTYIA